MAVSRAMVKPNIILVIFDTARADAFEPYGARAGSTPAVAQLAADGFSHPCAFAPSSWTVPSHASLLSGQLPRTTGIHLGGQSRESFRRVLGELEPRLLPTVLSASGYRTVGISANGWLNEASGFDTGFEEFRYLASSRYTRLGAQDLRGRARWAIDGLRARLDDGSARIERLLGEVTRGSRPFFCFVNLVECHSPYLPPKPHNPLGWRDRLRSVDDANRYCTFEGLCRTCLGALEVPDDSLERMQRLYLASIAQLDAWLSRLLSELDRRRLLTDTQVIVTSDHGENFGEGGLTGHQFSLDDRLLRVPFVTAGPLELDAPPLLSLVGVPQLLAGGVGLADHPWAEAAVDPAVALAQFEAPAVRGDETAERLVQDWNLGEQGQRRLFRSFSCATDGQVKLFRDATGEEIVDLQRDPLEEHPVPVQAIPDGSHGPALARLRKALDMADASTRTDLGDGALSGPTSEDSELEDQMRLLGYL